MCWLDMTLCSCTYLLPLSCHFCIFSTASIRQKFFVDRVINVWNALSSTANFASLSVFRNSIEKVDFSSFSRL